MPFELEKMTEVRVLDVGTLASKDRKPDDLPGAQLLLQATLSHGYLAMFDKTLPGWLYEPGASKQGSLEGIESVDLTSVGEHMKRLNWAYEQTGNTVVIDHGIGGKSNIELDDSRAYRLSFQPLKGGSVRVQWTLDVPALTDTTRGKLSGLKATNVKMTMHAPVPEDDPQSRIDDVKPAPAHKPGAPERAAVDKVKGVDASTKAPHKEAKPGDPNHVHWPFPTGSPKKIEPPPAHLTEPKISKASRTARGKAKTAAHLAAGKP